MTYNLSNFCSSNGIELMALFPNSTHLLQPMDVAVFRPLKQAWKNEVTKWRMENSGNKLQKHHFGSVFEKALAAISEQTITNGFRSSGLYPFNVENVNFAKISKTKTLPLTNCAVVDTIDSKILLKGMENKIGEEKVTNFKRLLTSNDECGVEDTSLFNLWKSVNEDVMGQKGETRDEENYEFDQEKENTPENENIRSKSVKTKTVDNPVSTCQESDVSMYVDIRDIPSTSKEIQIQYTSPIKTITRQTQTPEKGFPLNVPSPFKRALFWPDTQQPLKKRRNKEKIPSVITSSAWQEYHRKKETEKKKQLEEKQQRATLREQKKLEKLNKKVFKQVEEFETSDEEEESVESGDSLDDIDLFEKKQDDFCELQVSKNINIGDYYLVKFSGGKRNTINYRYVCVVQNVFADNDVEVMSLKVVNEEKTMFRTDEKDVSTVSKAALLGKLPAPNIINAGDRLKYQFLKPVDVFDQI